MPVWENWAGNVTAKPRRIVRPHDEGELVATVKQAGRSGEPVRVAGTGHSFVPIAATDGCLVSLDDDAGFEDFDSASLQATIRAGTKLTDVGAPLLERGMGLCNMGDVDVQSVAGALSTGTHGTGRTLRNLSSSIVGLRLVDARGELVECSAEREPALFEMARVALGVFGVVSAVRLQLLPAYRLRERVWQEDLEPCLATLDEKIEKNRHYEFFWYPGNDRCDQKAINPTDRDPEVGERERVDWSHRILPSVREVRFFEMEYSVPAASGLECFREVRAMLREKHPDVVWPVEYRTLAADDIPLSTAYERETVTISVHSDGRKPYEGVMRDSEAVFRNHAGRPHWGKLHWRTHAELRELYPRFDEFCALRRQRDPDGVFLNPFLRSLFEQA
jgi:FAD/FMN-containing dehydrogenase